MDHAHELPALLTEAAAMNPIVVMLGFNGTLTNARTVPYAERYQGFTGLWETPVEHLQRAAEDEAKRLAAT